jgi:hypothetical protein
VGARWAGLFVPVVSRLSVFDPEKEDKAGHVHITGESHDKEQWVSNYACACNHCGAAYKVEFGEYRYTWWKWQPLPPQNTEDTK